MKNKPYRRNPGELEIRILNSGQVVMVMPDEKLLEIARTVQLRPKETIKNAGAKAAKIKRKNHNK